MKAVEKENNFTNENGLRDKSSSKKRITEKEDTINKSNSVKEYWSREVIAKHRGASN